MTPDEAEEQLREQLDAVKAEIYTEREGFRALASLEPISATNLQGQVPEHVREVIAAVFDTTFDHWQAAVAKRALLYETLDEGEVGALQGLALQASIDACIDYVRGARILGLTKTPPRTPEEDFDGPAYTEDSDE